MARLGSQLGLNQDQSIIIDQIKTNIKRMIPQAQPYPEQEKPIILVGGGPSLETEFDKLVELREKGYPLVAVNGSFDYLLDKGLQPSMMVMLDSREFNKRFVERAAEAPNCKFFLCAQTHPAAFDFLEELGADVTLWHPDYDEKEQKAVHRWYLCDKPNVTYYAVLGGTTVITRAIWLMTMLGFPNQHIFGFDSCLSDDMEKHHAYKQEENDADFHTAYKLHSAGRTFNVTNWMVSQAENFLDMVKHAGAHFNLEVYGDGLISWVMQNVDHPELLIKDNNNGGSTLESL